VELRVRIGDGLVCDYSSQSAPSLVKFVNESSGIESGWMSEGALLAGLRMISSMVQQKPSQEVLRQDILTDSFNGSRGEGRRAAAVQTNTAAVAAFAKELVELINDPPRATEKEKEGLSELHIRTLMQSHLPAVGNRDAMYPVLNQYLGMTKERYDSIIGMLKNGRI
jgi:hypothetical protein